MSTFILESDNLNGSDIELAQQLDKNDMIYFYSKTGVITIDLHELLVTLKAKYTFYELPEDEIDIESYCIMLGILANTTSDNLILIYPEDSPISKLNNREFPGPKGSFKIMVCSDFKTALKLSKTGKSKKEPVKATPKKNSVTIKENKEESPLMKDDALSEGINFKSASMEFINHIRQLQTNELELVPYADAIAAAIRDADEADLALPMQLRVKCQFDLPTANDVCDLLREDYDELKKLAVI